MLGILGVDEADLTPQPSLGQVDRLVAQLAEGGLPVELRVEGDVRQLPAGLDLCGYRVVQEALTNSLKHGQPSATSLVVRYGSYDLELEVLDDGGGGRFTSGLPGGGRGLVGMRERVALYGGWLEAGRRPVREGMPSELGFPSTRQAGVEDGLRGRSGPGDLAGPRSLVRARCMRSRRPGCNRGSLGRATAA